MKPLEEKVYAPIRQNAELRARNGKERVAKRNPERFKRDPEQSKKRYPT